EASFYLAWRWLSPSGVAFGNPSRMHANGGAPREYLRHLACFSAASMRDQQVHLYEQLLLASIITPSNTEWNFNRASPRLVGADDLVKCPRKTRTELAALALRERIGGSR